MSQLPRHKKILQGLAMQDKRMTHKEYKASRGDRYLSRVKGLDLQFCYIMGAMKDGLFSIVESFETKRQAKKGMSKLKRLSKWRHLKIILTGSGHSQNLYKEHWKSNCHCAECKLRKDLEECELLQKAQESIPHLKGSSSNEISLA